MKHKPQIAFYAAAAILLAGTLIYKTTAPGTNRAALSLTMESGHFSFQAELGASLLALRL
jgi:hypothetical protein